MTRDLLDIDTLGTIVTIWAHPDDETYLAGGLMAAAAARAQRVVCITATDGEQGTTDAHPDPAALAPRRRQELTDALAKLGVREHVRFGLADGGCAALGERAPVDRLRREIEWFGADTVVTFGPDGVTGHPDHQAVSRWVDLALERGTERPVRLLHAASTQEHRDEFADVYERLALEMAPPPPVTDPLRLDLDARLLARKVAALRAHDSQTAMVFDLLGTQRMAEWVRTEVFVDART